MISLGPRHWAVINRAEFYVLTSYNGVQAYLHKHAQTVFCFTTLYEARLDRFHKYNYYFAKRITVKMLENLFVSL